MVDHAPKNKANVAPTRRITTVWARLDARRGSCAPAGATADALATLALALGGPVPDAFAASLAIHDGGVHLVGYDLLDVGGVARWLERAREVGRALVPIAVDGGRHLLVLDARGRVHALDLEGPGQPVRVAANLAAWLQSFATRMDSGELGVENAGFVLDVGGPIHAGAAAVATVSP